MTSLIIVESPAKARKIQSILANDDVIAKASMGHIRDLPEKELGVDIERNFEPKYIALSKKKQLIAELRTAARQCQTVYLAADEDREGEAIGWHLAQELRLPLGTTPRMVFHEITPRAIRQAFQSPRRIHLPSVNSQQTRRILDRLVGYTISPLLCRALGQGKLSAGRVQSAALRLLVERERDHEQFTGGSHISILGTLNTGKLALPVQWKPNQEEWTDELRAELMNWKTADWSLLKDYPQMKMENENPPPPFTTSTLAQESSKVLHYSTKMTAQLSQKLYEAGWITYHRTDSVALSDDAKQAIRGWIQGVYGEDKVKPRSYATKQKNAQEAHEAIRPARIDRIPGTNEEGGRSGGLDESALRLYALIWCRTISTQMVPAVYQKIVARWKEYKGENGVGDGNGNESERVNLEGYWEWTSRLLHQEGFYRVWREYMGYKKQETTGAEGAATGGGDRIQVVDFQADSIWKLTTLKAEERPQEPPGRYRESSFIKTLEQKGIGRPSTYASIVSTLTDRKYIEPKTNTPGKAVEAVWEVFLPQNKAEQGKRVVKVGAEKGVWVVSRTGREVCEYLEGKFGHLVESHFTATMESWLDEIARENTTMEAVLGVFWEKLSPLLETAKEEAKAIARAPREVYSLGVHPQLGLDVVLKVGRYGPYVECGKWKGSIQLPKKFVEEEGKLGELTVDALERYQNQFPVVLGRQNGAVVLWRQGPYGSYLELDGGQEGKGSVKRISWKEKEQKEAPSWEEVEAYLMEQGERDGAEGEKKYRELSKTIVAQTTRYGWALRKGKQWAKPPAGSTLETITLEEAKAAFESAPARRVFKKKSIKNSI